MDLDGLRILVDGQAIATGPDANALSQLNSQQAANWNLVAALSDLPIGSAADVRVEFGSVGTVDLVSGQPLDTQVPYLLAWRLTGSGAFDIESVGSIETSFSTLAALLDPDDSTLDPAGTIVAAAGTDLPIDGAGAWNDTASAVIGTIEVNVCQGESCVNLHSSSLTVPALDQSTTGSLTLTTSTLHQGDYELEAAFLDGGGAVVHASRMPLSLTGPDSTIAFTGQQTEISLSAGGQVDLWVGADATAAGATYTIYMSGTGGIPGIDLGDVFLPLVNDAWTSLGISLLGAPNFPGGTGTLDGSGFATAAFVVDPGTDPNLAGTRLYFAPLVDTAPRLSSAAPYVVELVP